MRNQVFQSLRDHCDDACSRAAFSSVSERVNPSSQMSSGAAWTIADGGIPRSPRRAARFRPAFFLVKLDLRKVEPAL